ncbi:hypothetical protein CS542_01990 [Pedobacter sp. IW39]|nr:hypothetical protein CS542_01990 [Pedobacter sp. IW39]
MGFCYLCFNSAPAIARATSVNGMLFSLLAGGQVCFIYFITNPDHLIYSMIELVWPGKYTFDALCDFVECNTTTQMGVTWGYLISLLPCRKLSTVFSAD